MTVKRKRNRVDPIIVKAIIEYDILTRKRPPSISELLAKFHIGASTLQRDMADNGTSVRKLTSEVYIKLIKKAVLEKGIKDKRELAAIVGFTDPDSIPRLARRAFSTSYKGMIQLIERGHV